MDIFGLGDSFKSIQKKLDGADIREVSDRLIQLQRLLVESKGWYYKNDGWYHHDINTATYIIKTLLGDKVVSMLPVTLNAAFEHETVALIGSDKVQDLCLKSELDSIMKDLAPPVEDVQSNELIISQKTKVTSKELQVTCQ